MTKNVPRGEFGNDSDDEGEHLLHVLDLPQLYSRPSCDSLSKTLDLLKLQSNSFSASSKPRSGPKVDPQGVPHYLTLIISSSLSWLKDDSEREQIWDNASARLSERSGRNAMPSMTRTFHITDGLSINLFEPSLTEDNLGLKTWTSSLLLARRLPQLRHHLETGCKRILELGSGTGLVGIAAAVLWNVDVVLTDLPEILPNLEKNVQSNRDLIENTGRRLRVRSLDWANSLDIPASDDEKFSLIIAADPIYSSDHPRILIEATSRWIRRSSTARLVIELPLRKGYEEERADLRKRLVEAHMVMVEEGTEIGFDDWESIDGRPMEVECWWSIWRLSDRDTDSQ